MMNTRREFLYKHREGTIRAIATNEMYAGGSGTQGRHMQRFALIFEMKSARLPGPVVVLIHKLFVNGRRRAI